ncbi:MAG: aspartate kinase, partial [Cyclobacteriaceae bacterium]|nr:aspartate kinase [Cyclobacteriaceae bacterium]
MLIFKFGGASVKNADAVRNIIGILKDHKGHIIVVVSAMGKTTNNLERIIDNYVNRNGDGLTKEMDTLKSYHYEIIDDLFDSKSHLVYDDIDKLFVELGRKLEREPSLNYDHDYDQIICFGELLSTKIITHYLQSHRIKAEWKDVRFSIKTNNTYREARVNWDVTRELVKEHFQFEKNQILVTQGFLGSTIDNITTTLGREGS